MEKKPDKNDSTLVNIQDSLDSILSNLKNLEEDDILYYEAIKKLVDLKLNEGDFNERLKEIENVMLALGKLDFTKRVQIENSKDLFTFLGSCINLVAEELEANAIPKEFLTSSMNILLRRKPEVALLADQHGKIISASGNTEILGYKQDKLTNSKIQGVLTIDLQFTAENLGNIEDVEIHYINPNHELASALISIDKIEHPTEVDQTHYLYSFKQIK
jgi:signal transduction histidine kinase